MKQLLALLSGITSPVQLSVEQKEQYTAHIYLGKMYLSLGRLADAELEYCRAQSVCPTAETTKILGLIRQQRVQIGALVVKNAGTRRAA